MKKRNKTGKMKKRVRERDLIGVCVSERETERKKEYVERKKTKRLRERQREMLVGPLFEKMRSRFWLKECERNAGI